MYKSFDITIDVFLSAYTDVIVGQVDDSFAIGCTMFAILDIILAILSMWFGKFGYFDMNTNNIEPE